MAEQLMGEHLVERSPEETLAFDTPRLQVNAGPSASHFMFQRRLRLLTKVSAASLRTLEAGDSNLQVKSVAMDESDVTVVVLLCLGDTTLVTYLDVCAPGLPVLRLHYGSLWKEAAFWCGYVVCTAERGKRELMLLR